MLARVAPEFGGLEKGQSLISAYWSLSITLVGNSNEPPQKNVESLSEKDT